MTKEIKIDKSLDSFLRPIDWSGYIGQDIIKKQLSILLQAAKEREQTPEHILLHGPPGLGKTTLAHIIGNEQGAKIREVSGSLIEKAGDIISIVSSMEKGEVFFMDEIHRIGKGAEEVLYPIMESGKINILVGKGPTARNVKIDLPSITIVGATTKLGSLSAPLRSRFSGGVLSFDFYSEEEIRDIIKQSAKKLEVSLTDKSAKEIAKRSRQTPRTANYLLKRVRDFAQVNKKDITPEIIDEVLNMLEIDKKGLNKNDRALLEMIYKKFNGGPVGLSTLAMTLSEDERTIEEFYEPFLVQIGLLDRTQRGRKITKKGREFLE